ncbi:MAG: divalent-cation tolerance protein CutA [Candidatus Kapabacteria bacterium]|nr:divalent-cation tolerance protein CutA [Candidatus Kapabacteria bacterium]
MENANNYCIVFVTIDSLESAQRMSRVIVNEKLAACCTILPNSISIYGWKGTLHERSEQVIMIKTLESKLIALKDRILEIHNDEVPEIISINLNSGLSSYLNWISTSLLEENE